MTSLSSASAIAADSAGIVKRIQQAKIFPVDQQLAVDLKDAEAQVSTYAERTGDWSKNCKIRAVLTARQVMTEAPDVVKVKMLFYNYARTEYALVTVSVGDVKAFGNGMTDEKKLLQSLGISRVQIRPPAGSATTAQRTNGSGAAAAGLQTISKSKDFEMSGLSFRYPGTWLLTQTAPNTAQFVRAAGTVSCLLIVKIDDGMTKEFLADAVVHAANNTVKVVKTESAGIGKYGIPAVTIDTFAPAKPPPNYVHYVIFDHGGKQRSCAMVLAIQQLYDKEKFQEFEQILSSLTFQP